MKNNISEDDNHSHVYLYEHSPIVYSHYNDDQSV